MKKLVGFMVVALAGCGEEGVWSTGGGAQAGAGPQAAVSNLPSLWGTQLLPFGNGSLAIADAESDSVLVMHRNQKTPVRFSFSPGAQPFRVVATRKNQLAVVLRGSGAIVRVSVPVSGAVPAIEASQLTHVCDEPRGIAYDEKRDALEVACAGGELATVDSNGGVTTVDTGLELRDLFKVGTRRWATTFRTASLVELADDGSVVSELPAPTMRFGSFSFAPRVAWRTVSAGTNKLVMVHQLHLNDEVAGLTNPTPTQPYYGRPYCNASVVQAALTVFDLEKGIAESSRAIVGALPIDVAANPDLSNRFAVAFAGTGQVSQYDVFAQGTASCLSPTQAFASPTPTGVAWVDGDLQFFDHGGTLTRTAKLDEPQPLIAERPLDEGRQVFHAQSPSGVACASCHPEGHDDGHIWQFGPKQVRSQSLEGGLLNTAPFHWDGHLARLSDVFNETFVVRMGAERPKPATVAAVGNWLDTLPAREARHTSSALTHKLGRRTFIEAKCDTCHAGEHLTNGTTVDVGTGGKFQVPTLKALRWRGPWMHDGCAKTLTERFTNPACGGRTHGETVAPGRVPELVEYLMTL